MEKLSFVIPAYNEEHGISACLDSILAELRSADAQAEIVVVNNASTDRTKEFVQKNYPMVRVVDEPHKGIVWARRRGFLSSHGELVANIDADTRLLPGWVTTVLAEFQKNPKLVCLSGPYSYADLPLGTQILVKLFYGGGFLIYFLNRFVLKIGSMVQGGNFVCRRSSLSAIGGFDTSIDFYGEDTDIARRMSHVGDVKFTFRLPTLSSGRRIAQDGLVTTGARYALNFLWVTFAGKPFTTTSRDIRPPQK